MARAKSDQLGPCSHVVPSDGMVPVPTVGLSGVPPDVDVFPTKIMPVSQQKFY